MRSGKRSPAPQRREAQRGLGHTLLQLALVLTLVGSALQDDFLLALGLGALAFVLVARLWDSVSFVGLHYTRRFHSAASPLGGAGETRAFLGETVDLALEVRNRKVLPLTWLEVVDRVPGSLPIDDTKVLLDPVTNLGELRTFWRPGAFTNATRHYTVHCDHRGYYDYGPVTMTTGDGFGFFRRTLRLETPQLLIVYPRIYSALELRLPSEHPFGEKASRQYLFEDPLRTAGVREWEPADSMRRIHWPATARRQRLLSRLYEPSQDPQVLVCLNMATLPRHWEGIVPEMLERAISVAASLAVLCVEMRMSVGLLANGYWPGSDQVLRLMPGRSPDQLTRVLEMLAAVTGFASRPLEEMLLREGPRMPWGSTLLVVTPIAHDELLHALVELRKEGQRVVLFTLAEEPPAAVLPGVWVYHLPHLVEDLIVPQEVAA